MWFVEESVLLSLLPPDQVKDKLKLFSIHQQVKKNTIIYGANDPSDHVYLIKKGRVRLVRPTKDGHQITLSILGKGMIFGESDVLNEETYSHYAETVEPSYICSVDKQTFKQLLNKYDKVNGMILSIIHKRWKEAQQQIEYLAFSDVKTRLIHNLHQLSEKFGELYNKNGIEGILINMTLSQEQLADYIGSSRETVNRMIKDMKNEGMIYLLGKKILLSTDFFQLYAPNDHTISSK